MAFSDFSFLDSDSVGPSYTTKGRLRGLRFFVEGMRCGQCVRKLENLPATTPGVLSSRANLTQKTVEIEFDSKVIQPSKVAESIETLGFVPIPVTTDIELSTLSQKTQRQTWIRLGVAGACAANIMTFSFSTYFGASGDWATAFGWLSFALYLPVVTYVAWPFYQGAYRSLKQRSLSIDLPMAVASLAGFVFSTIQLIRGQSDYYFDSLSGFLFLILVSRAIQQRLQTQFLSKNEFAQGLELKRLRKLVSSGWHWVKAEEIKAGQGFVVLQGDTLAAEGLLESDSALFSLAWLTGESNSRRFLKGATVPAGSVLLSPKAIFLLNKPIQDTQFGKILETVHDIELNKSSLSNMSDRWSQVLLGVVFAAALIFLGIYWSVSPQEAIRRSLALIILACPCAMAFGTPLALASALKRARRHGLVIKDLSVLDRLLSIETVAFDKTGTLTDSNLTLVAVPSIAPVYLKIILALENESHHPIAFAFRKAFSHLESHPPVTGLRESPGVGVSGYIYGRFYELKHLNTRTKEIACGLFEEGILLAKFEFSAQLREDALASIDKIRSYGLKTHLLSGDTEGSVFPVAEQLGFHPTEVHASLSPCDKASWVNKRQNTMMIGDGINDGLALASASVGVAASGSIEAALKSSKVYLAKPSLNGLVELFELAKHTKRHVRHNLLLSLGYNLSGGVLALMGHIHPFTAALLMPASSGLIIFLSWLRDEK